MTNMDKLYEAVEARGPVCVGLDTDFSYLPEEFVRPELTAGENILRFNQAIIEATKAVSGCYKVQVAYYESLGLDGMRAYAETLKAVRAAGVPVIAGTAMAPSFGHIFSGGYAAGYYGYKWAEVLAADAFSLFKEKGIFNPEVAEAFRREILSKGGHEHPMTLYVNFRGHKPETKALIEKMGLEK